MRAFGRTWLPMISGGRSDSDGKAKGLWRSTPAEHHLFEVGTCGTSGKTTGAITRPQTLDPSVQVADNLRGELTAAA